MRFVSLYIKSILFIALIIISTHVFSQPGFTPPGQGGTPPGNPCPGPPWQPCPQIPIDSGVGLLIAAGIAIGIRKIKKNKE